MELQTERKDGILTFCLRGRLDGYGAGQLADAISASLQDDDRSVVFDLAELSYLSSAGIRVLVATKKQLKERGGILALAGIQDYPKSVLDMAGVTPIFSIYAGVEEAIAACKRPLDSLSVINEITRAPVVRNGVTYTIERASTQSSSLRVVGRLDKMLRARLTEEDIRAIPFSALQVLARHRRARQGCDRCAPAPRRDDHAARLGGMAPDRWKRHTGLLHAGEGYRGTLHLYRI